MVFYLHFFCENMMEVHDVKSRDGGNLEKTGEGQGGERSLEGEEGKPTGGSQEAETEGGASETPQTVVGRVN